MTSDKRLYVSLAPLRALITLSHAYLFLIGVFPKRVLPKPYIASWEKDMAKELIPELVVALRNPTRT